MNTKNKIIITVGALVVLIGLWVSPIGVSLGSTVSGGAPTFKVASSTSYILGQTSTRILSTSTPTRRMAVTVQPISCTAGGPVFLSTNDVVAVTSGTSTIAVFASTTQSFGDYPNVPVVQGSVQAITQTGTCTVLVTEWRSQH